MEVALGRSDHESRIKEEKTTESGGPGDADHPKQEINIEVPPVNDTCGPIVSSTEKEEVEKLESAKTEMGEVREENQRLKQSLDRVMKDYRTLEMKFQHIFQKETKHQSTSTCSEPDDLVSLSLGRVICSNNNNNNARTNDDDHQKSQALKALLLKDNNNGGDEEDLALGLDCKFETSRSGSITTNNNNSSPNIINPSPTNSSHQEPVINNESKALKTSRDSYSGEDEVSQHNPPKRARVCVKARCDAPTMNDGCHWRKYGQKISKGNPCPKAYYRCTVAPSCPVKKQVQRCAEDMSVLVTTYEGIHNHPLPLSATAIASTTSAAASMLLSASSSSSSAVAAATATIPSLYFSNNPSSLSSSSSLPSHSTITLDLTTNSAASRFFMTSSLSSSNYNPPPRSSSFPSSTSLNFSSPNNNNFLSYNSNNRNLFSSMNLARSTTVDNNIYRLPYVQRNSVINNPTHHHHPHPPPPQPATLPDSIADATKAIAADPKFQSALAVALSSIIGTGGSGIGSSSQGQGNRGGAGENLPQKVKWGELFPAL